MFHDIGVPPTEQHDAALAAQLFKCGLVVWWRTPSLLHRLECEVVPGGGWWPLPGARILSTRLAISRQLFAAWCRVAWKGSQKIDYLGRQAAHRRMAEQFASGQMLHLHHKLRVAPLSIRQP